VIVVIDASVAIMWVLEEPGSAAAFALKEEELIAHPFGWSKQQTPYGVARR